MNDEINVSKYNYGQLNCWLCQCVCLIHWKYFFGHSRVIACYISFLCRLAYVFSDLPVFSCTRAAPAPGHSGQFSFMLLYLTIFQRYAIYRLSVARQTVNRLQWEIILEQRLLMTRWLRNMQTWVDFQKTRWIIQLTILTRHRNIYFIGSWMVFGLSFLEWQL